MRDALRRKIERILPTEVGKRSLEQRLIKKIDKPGTLERLVDIAADGWKSIRE